jgi:hypothetical protein
MYSEKTLTTDTWFTINSIRTGLEYNPGLLDELTLFKLHRTWRQHAPPKRTAIYQTTGRPKNAAFNIRYLQELTHKNEESHTIFTTASSANVPRGMLIILLGSFYLLVFYL